MENSRYAIENRWTVASKLSLLLSTLVRDPKEFRDRVSMIVASRWPKAHRRPTYSVQEDVNALKELSGAVDWDLRSALREPALTEIECDLGERIKNLPKNAPFATFHNGDVCLGRFSYALTRALRPALIIETGVCYGVTSAFLLKALDVNGAGLLHSIDLPPLGKRGDDYVGHLIPAELRHRWVLHRGTSERLLPPLLDRLGRVDLFVHDSLHTYRNMRMEFESAWAALRPGGVLISDDIHGNSAFRELMSRPDVSCAVVVQEKEKQSLLGVSVKGR